jgi:predicted nucleic acid-binding protein
VLTAFDTDLHVPALCDVEVASALRRSLMAQLMTQERAVEALEDHLSLPLTRHGHQALLARVLDLRDALTAYDAVYVALAEALGAALLTADQGLASAARGMTELVVLPEGRAP